MRSRNMVVLSAAVVVVVVAVFGTVGYGIYAGLTAAHRGAPQSAIVTGVAPATSTAQRGASNVAAAPGTAGVPAADAAAGMAQPAPGTFFPGGPPYGGAGGVAADGISAWGIAYRETTDASAQADTALVKSAYQDAEKKATDLATATGNKLGKLLALTDYSSNQPYFKPCVQMGVPAPGKPVPQASSGGGSTSSSGPAIAIAPAPCQATGNSYYLVVWVYVRHAL